MPKLKSYTDSRIADIFLNDLLNAERKGLPMPFITETLTKLKVYYTPTIAERVFALLEAQEFIQSVPNKFSSFSYPTKIGEVVLPSFEEGTIDDIVALYQLTSKGRHFVASDQKLDSTRENVAQMIWSKIEQNKLLASIMVGSTIIIAIILFYEKVSPYVNPFFGSTGKTDERSTDLFYYLANKKIVECDRHQGIHFKDFLHKLKRAGSLDLIPQCKPLKGYGNTTEWHFYAVKLKRPVGKLRPIKSIPDESIAENEIRKVVFKLPCGRDGLVPLYEQAKLIKYKRVWCIWTEDEDVLLRSLYTKTKSIHKLAMLLQRQESAVEVRLKTVLRNQVK
ncbi:MAG: hypothetical protein SH819_08040 [Cytophagales bacterium]|nr:hypothetical protein [Cytophagales bacterium]